MQFASKGICTLVSMYSLPADGTGWLSLQMSESSKSPGTAPASFLSGNKKAPPINQNNDPVAKECFEYTGKILGTKLSDTVIHTDPEAIFIMGGLAQAGSLIIDPIKKHIEANLMPLFKGRVKVLPSELENQTAPILGAGSLVWNYLEKNPLKTA